ncbi:unnamed protein product, partial [Closterium sp. NIES-53]
MASLPVLAFDHEGRPVQFDTWLDDLQLYLLSDSKDSVSLFDLATGAATAPPATADSATRSQWLTHDAAVCLAICNHLPLAECTHFGQHRTAQALYDAVVARYSSPATAALGRLLLPYLFPELFAFATVEDLVSHLRASDACYRTAAPAEFLDKNQPPMFITLYFIVTRLFDSLRSVRDHFLSLDPTSLTVDLLKQHLLAAETRVLPSPLAPSYASTAAAHVSVAEDVGATSASVKRRNSKGKGGKGGGGGSGSGGGGSGSSGGGSSGGGGGGGTGGGSGGSGGGGGGSGGSGGSGGGGTGGARRVGLGGGQRQQQQRRSETQSSQHLREWFLQRAASGGSIATRMSLPPLPPSPAPPCLPCVEGRQRAAPHSSSFPPTTAPLQTLHMDVKGQVSDVLIPWIRTVRLQLRERFGQDLPVLRLHSDRGGEFSSNLLWDFCCGEGILQSFTLLDSPQKNGIVERCIGLVMEVARTSMIHAAAPHFLWPFAVRYAAHQLNLWPRVSLPETSPTLRWTGKVDDASVFRVWGSRAFVRDTFADKLFARAIPCVFLGFVPHVPGWQFYHPTSRRVLLSHDVTFDESVPFYRLFPYRSGPLPPPPLFLAPGPPLVDPLPPQGPAPSGVSQVDPPLGAVPGEVASGGTEPEGAGSRGAEPGVAERAGAEPGGGESGGPAGVSPRLSSRTEPLSLQQLREWLTRRAQLR